MHEPFAHFADCLKILLSVIEQKIYYFYYDILLYFISILISNVYKYDLPSFKK